MTRFIEGEERSQITLLPECLDDYITVDSPVLVVDVFVDELKLPLDAEDADPPVSHGPAPAVTRERSVQGELFAQDRGDVLTLAQQPDHIEMVFAFEVAPQQRELRHLPGAKPRNTEQLAERR